MVSSSGETQGRSSRCDELMLASSRTVPNCEAVFRRVATYRSRLPVPPKRCEKKYSDRPSADSSGVPSMDVLTGLGRMEALPNVLPRSGRVATPTCSLNPGAVTARNIVSPSLASVGDQTLPALFGLPSSWGVPNAHGQGTQLVPPQSTS